MILKSLATSFSDSRGKIIDIISQVNFDSLTVITSKEGAVRGNHYHKQTMQYVYVLSGSTKYAYRPENAEKVFNHVLNSGDLVVTPPNEHHAFLALEDTTWLVMTKGPRAGRDYENDTYRLTESLL